MLLYYYLAFGLSVVSASTAADEAFYAGIDAASQLPSSQKWPQDLVGTWSTKSLSTLTGPGFFDFPKDALIEPAHTGISYSFSSDGHWEEALFRAIAAPANPSCPQGMLQWQHGSFAVNATGSIFAAPIKVDGRQLLSNPCEGDHALYMRYNQSEIFQSYTVQNDPYHNVQRLDMYQWDGTPMNPMYLVYRRPQMLPTTTLNPLPKSTSTRKSKEKKRSVQQNGSKDSNGIQVVHRINAERLWWIGIGLTGVGGLLHLGSRRTGVRS